MKKGELALLLSKDESYLVEVSSADFHTKSGMIKLGELRKKKFGDEIKTHTGKEFTIVKPDILDIIDKKVKRSAQVIMPKDVALILAYTGIGPGDNVVDAGTGSGYLAILLANYVRPGKIVTYEKSKRFAEIARRNIKSSGLKNIRLKEKDITKDIDEKNVDAVILDLQKSQKAINHAYKALRAGGWLVVYSPTIESLMTVLKPIRKKDFCRVKTVENIVREWKTGPTTRPRTMGLMHTGFLTFARKLK
jgi:tRNA (adenine57-N1/adenine58-N1)-methyltransferase